MFKHTSLFVIAISDKIKINKWLTLDLEKKEIYTFNLAHKY